MNKIDDPVKCPIILFFLLQIVTSVIDNKKCDVPTDFWSELSLDRTDNQ